MKSLFIAFIFAMLGIVLFTGTDKNEDSLSQDIEQLKVEVYPLSDGVVKGFVTFKQKKEGVLVEAKLSGLTDGKHGFHIHEYGNCSATDGSSAGGHFNPFGKKHSSRYSDNRHMGDMGNIVGDENGMAELSYIDTNIDLSRIIGRGIVVHAGEDDLNSQPSGAAGARIACGVIGISK